MHAVVIGGGHAGLAASQQLAHRGVDHVVLERSRIGESWLSMRWDSFALNTPSWSNRMPGDIEADVLEPRDGFPTHHQLVERLAAYAERWDLPVETDRRLREMDFGDWDGRPWSEVKESDEAFFRRWKDSWWHRPPPGGESVGDVARRAESWLTEILDCPGRTVVAVAHGGTIRTALCHALGVPLERVFHLRLDHGLVSGNEIVVDANDDAGIAFIVRMIVRTVSHGGRVSAPSLVSC